MSVARGTIEPGAGGHPRRRIAVAALYAGGFLGPFGGAVTSSVLPEIGGDFRVSAGVAAGSLTAYLLPFAALMVVSGALGARWGARRTVLVAYVVYALASVLCVVAWTFPVLLAGRALQGAANSFTTPLLLATIAAVTPAERLGRSLGLFASMQAAGQTTAPLVGGLAAEVSWRWAFAGAAVVAVGLAVGGLPADPPREQRPGLRSAWTWRTLRLAGTGMVVWGCLGGLSYLVALRLGDDFGLTSGERGLLLTGFGVAGIATARLTGWFVDHVGPRRSARVGAVVGAVVVALVGVLPNLVAVGVLWAAAGALSQAVVVGLNAIALRGDTPGGSVSVVQALRFLGAAVSPLAFVPLYHLDATAAFLAPAVATAVTAAVLLTRRGLPTG
ncbi:MFS transporter [Actinosynnema sp. NPDC020468]|uniref:MFS transporter n=1 Tax=Actinosynnema sp. NPDC020468 TaxID=3154488 RepID=UPI0033EE7C75